MNSATRELLAYNLKAALELQSAPVTIPEIVELMKGESEAEIRIVLHAMRLSGEVVGRTDGSYYA